MKILEKQICKKLIEDNKNNIYVIAPGNGILKNSAEKTAAYIAFSEESAYNFFKSISAQLPESMKNFQVFKFNKVDDIYSLKGLFNSEGFDKILIVDYGYLLESYLYKTNEDNVMYVWKEIGHMCDNEKFYLVFDENDKYYKINDKIAIFLELESAQTACKNCNGKIYAYQIIEPLFRPVINDLADFNINGKNVSGWEFNEAIARKFNNDCFNKEEIKKILKDKIAICIATDSSGACLGMFDSTLFFTNQEDYEIYDKSVMTHPYALVGFVYQNIPNEEMLRRLLNPHSNYIFFDGKRHCKKQDFIDIVMELK